MQNKYQILPEEKVVAVRLNKNSLEDLQAFLTSVEESLVSLIRQQVYQCEEARQETINLWLETKDHIDIVQDMLSFNDFKTAN